MILRGSWLLVGLWTDWGIPCFLSEPRRGRTYWKGLLAVGTMVVMSLSSLGSCFGTDNKVTVPDITECRFCKKCVQPSNELKRRLHESSEGQEPWGDVEFLQRHLRGDTSSTTLSQQAANSMCRNLMCLYQKSSNTQTIILRDLHGINFNHTFGSGNRFQHAMPEGDHPGVPDDRDADGAELDSFISQASYAYIQRADPRTNLSLCETCTGCTVNLDVWADRGVKHSIKVGDFVPPVGRSSTWIFRAPSRKAASGVGIAKVWCLPFKKQHGIKVDDCIPSKRNDIMSKLAAYTKLARDCGVADVVSSSWVEQVKAIMPGTGYVIDGPGLFSDIAPGVSAHFLAHQATDNNEILRIFQSIKKDQVVKSAVFDLLVGNCDRHPGNLFVDESGKLTLIDNDMSLSGKCVANSIFLPSTNYHAKERHAGKATILDLLDYRCHVQGGQINTSYPPSLAKCLAKLKAMSTDDISDVYGFPSSRSAWLLKHRAGQLLAKGFEWTLLESRPFNGTCVQRLPYSSNPCCKFDVRMGNLQCSDRHWIPDAQIQPSPVC